MKIAAVLLSSLLPFTGARGASVPENAVYPWATEVRGVVSKETHKPPRAYLWLPPKATKVKGVVLGMHNMLEEPIFAHPAFRKHLASANLGLCWVTPMIPQQWDALATNEIAAIERLMEDFAARTGRPELAAAPIAPIGHSAMATYPYLWAAARPERTLCAVSLKGDWPTKGRPCWESAQAAAKAHVPLLLVSGEYEDGYHRRELSRDLMKAVPDATFSMWIDVGGGHFDWSDELCDALGQWFAVIAKRGGAFETNASTKACPVDAIVPIASIRSPGVTQNGFWYPTAALAKLVADYEALPRGKGAFTVLGYEYEGKVVKQDPKAHLQVIFGTKANTFEVRPVFDTIVPPGRPETWTGLPAGAANPVPGLVGRSLRERRAAPDPTSRLLISRIDGPVDSDDGIHWRVRYNRYDPVGRRAREASLQLVYPGDGQFKRCVQQALVKVPAPRTDFVEKPPRRVTRRDFPLSVPAGSAAYVREGPAQVENGKVVLSDVPQKGPIPPIELITYSLDGHAAPVHETLQLVRASDNML